LEGLEISEVMLSEVAKNNKSMRIDSAYFAKESEAIDRALKKSSHFFLKKAEVVSGPFGSTLKSHSYLQEGVPFVRVQNIKGGFEIQKNEIVYISEKDNDTLKNSQLVVDDLVLSKVGNTIGYYARVDEELERCNISENNIGIKLSSYYVARRHYILTFLNSSYGKTLTLRKVSGNAQPKLNVSDINDIPIPQRSEIFESQISFLIIESLKIKHRSITIYTQAESLLLKSLSLDHPPLEGGSKSQLAGDSGRGCNLKTNSNFNSIKKFPDPSPNASHSTLPQGEGDLLCAASQTRAQGEGNSSQYCYNTSINIKSFKDSFLTTGRLDAEYYQPKYEEVIAHIKSQPHAKLSELVAIKKSIEPGSDEYSENDEGLPFLRVADYNKFGITEPQKKLKTSFVIENQSKLDSLMPKAETVLFSKDGSVGEAYCLSKDSNFITSGAILHLCVLDKKKVLPDYLTLALNSKLVRMQAERDAGGSIILHWRVSEIEEVLIPIIDPKTQSQISLLIQESFALKSKSEKLLELAKKAVEMAIEESEEKAIKFINQQAYSN